MADFETFNMTGFNLTQHETVWPRLGASFGDGYRADALAGSAYGLITFTLECTALPEDEMYMVSSEETIPQTRATYAREFFARHQVAVTGSTVTAVNKPFIITDPTTSKRYYVSLVEPKTSLAVITAKLFTTGIQLEQRRIRGVNTLPDGSIGDDDNPDEV